MAKIDEIMAVVWDLLGDPHFKFVEKELRGKISAILASPEVVVVEGGEGMNLKEWAEALNGVEYSADKIMVMAGDAMIDGVAIAYGASDDLLEFEGAIREEYAAYEGTARTPVKGGRKVTAIWCPKDKSGKVWASWEIRTKIPHETFDIMEEGDLFCRGIVFYLRDAKEGVA